MLLVPLIRKLLSPQTVGSYVSCVSRSFCFALDRAMGSFFSPYFSVYLKFPYNITWFFAGEIIESTKRRSTHPPTDIPQGRKKRFNSENIEKRLRKKMLKPMPKSVRDEIRKQFSELSICTNVAIGDNQAEIQEQKTSQCTPKRIQKRRIGLLEKPPTEQLEDADNYDQLFVRETRSKRRYIKH